jgi:hypothetical protein
VVSKADLLRLQDLVEKLPADLTRSYFVDGARYRQSDPEWKHRMAWTERRTLRHGGEIGQPGTVVFARLTDRTPDETADLLLEFVVLARSVLPTLLKAIVDQ